MKWILASASPRRKTLFAELVNEFEIIPAKGEENVVGAETVEALVKALATQKAREVAALPCAVGKAVLGADTVVSLDGRVLGKPKDEAEATEMLAALSDREHEVLTGVCMISPERVEYVAAACTKVRFMRLTKEKIAAYVATGSPMDKAGAYGIQDGGLVRSLDGSFSNVVGLPVELCREMLSAMKEGKVCGN